MFQSARKSVLAPSWIFGELLFFSSLAETVEKITLSKYNILNIELRILSTLSWKFYKLNFFDIFFISLEFYLCLILKYLFQVFSAVWIRRRKKLLVIWPLSQIDQFSCSLRASSSSWKIDNIFVKSIKTGRYYSFIR